MDAHLDCSNKCGLDRFYTPREVAMFVALGALLVSVSMLLEFYIGWVLTFWIFGGFWLALVCGPMGRPSALSVAMWTMLIFMGSVVWFRGYLTECRSQWKLRFHNEYSGQVAGNFPDFDNKSIPISVLVADAQAALRVTVEQQSRLTAKQNSSSIDGSVTPQLDPLEVSRSAIAAAEAAQMAAKLQANAESDEDFDSDMTATDNEDLRRYCSEQNVTENPVQFFPLLEPRDLPGFLNRDVKNLFRASCPVWTCTFTQQSSSSEWVLRLAILLCALIHLAYSCLACPTKCCPKLNYVNDLFGCGRCRFWWIWVWVYVIPVWVVTYITWIKGFSFNDLYKTIPEFIEVAIDDLEKSLAVIVMLAGFLIIWLARNRVRQILGLDDRNLIHTNLDNADAKGFQMCIWTVVGNQRDFTQASASWQKQPRSSSSMDWITRFSQTERNLLPGQGRACNIFCRLAYGDNEPQTSRIVRMTQSMGANTVIAFKETFRLELVNDIESEVLMHIEVRDQSVIGAQELGRVTLSVADIMKELDHSAGAYEELKESDDGLDLVATGFLTRLRNTPPWSGEFIDSGIPDSREDSPLLDHMCCCFDSAHPREGNNGERELGEAETQVLWMMTSDPQDTNNSATKEQLRKVGFKPHRLSKGGSIWLAFARIYD